MLTPLIRAIAKAPDMEADLLVSGTHLLKKYGETVQYIENDGNAIAYRIPIMEEDFSGTEREVTESIARCMEQCSGIFEKEKYAGLIVLGDRYELMGVCVAAMMFRIPIVHIHGGEVTEGAIDEKIRHAITKMASVHFPSVEEYAQRIMQMGENPDFVYPVGALGIDSIVSLPLMEKEELYKELGIETERKVAAVTYHPVTSLSRECAMEEIRSVMEALKEAELYSVITMPNSDAGGEEIFRVILEYTERMPDRFVLKKSLGQLRYLSLLKNADVMVGNSSSGILESASFALPTVNIGDRQKGRMAPMNVIHCECTKQAVLDAIGQGMSKEFRKQMERCVNPYGDGNTANKMIEYLRAIDWNDTGLLQKHFFDR